MSLHQAVRHAAALVVATLLLSSMGQPGQAAAGGCRVTVKDNIEKATTWKHTPGSRCDLLIDGFVSIRAPLSVQPGTVLLFTEASALNIDTNGSLNAVGTAKAPIQFAGTSSAAGLWSGLDFGSRSARNVLQFVQVRGAGHDTTTDAAIRVTSSGQVSVLDSLIAGNRGRGLSVGESSYLGRFARNSFQGNGKAPVSLPASQAGQLDAATDYAGRLKPNGLAMVILDDGDVKDPASWPGISFRVDAIIKVNAPLTVQPGADLTFREGMWLSVESNGSLHAVGTEKAHIRFVGEEEGTPGFWSGLQISSNRDNVLGFVDIVGAGARSSSDGLFGNGIYSQGGRLKISNSSISGSENYGIWVTKETALTIDDTVKLEGNARGKLFRHD